MSEKIVNREGDDLTKSSSVSSLDSALDNLEVEKGFREPKEQPIKETVDEETVIENKEDTTEDTRQSYTT